MGQSQQGESVSPCLSLTAGDVEVRETVRAYTQKLPVPGRQRPPGQTRTEDEVAEEIIELKKALNTARHDLQIEKVRNRRYEKSVGKHKKTRG